MTTPSLDILGIGNAIVDVLARAEDAFLAEHGMAKGGMALIGTDQAEAIYAAMGPGIEGSGGSAANTCAVAAGLGARVGYLGKVADDALGKVFRHDITAAGVHFPTPPLVGGAPTARCLILVSPDGQRPMNTFLGACVPLVRRIWTPPPLPARGLSIWKAICSTRRRPRPPSGLPPASRIKPGGRWRSRCQTPSVWAATALPSAPLSRKKPISSSPMRQRFAPFMKPMISSMPPRPCAPRWRSPP